MNRSPHRAAPRGLTLIELMVVIGVIALLVALTVPSMREMIAQQRLKSVNAELVTDLQFARSEAVSRNRTTYVRFRASSDMTCYVIYIPGASGSCNCLLPPGSACTPAVNPIDPIEEIRTIQVPTSTGVVISTTPSTAQDLVFSRDGMRTVTTDYRVETRRVSPDPGRIQITVNAMGRPTVCSPDVSVTGVPSC